MTYKIHLIGLYLFTQFLSAQTIEVQKNIGEERLDYVFDAKKEDDGFLLVGSSDRIPQENVTIPNGLDYWLVKTDESGNKLLEKSYGGTKSDFLHSISSTNDGGYLLVGASDSPKSGEKTTEAFGNFDLWVLKTDLEGKIIWQKSYGGQGLEQVLSVKNLADGTFILVGGSDSTPVFKDENQTNSATQEKIEPLGEKTAPNFGSSDYWVLKIDALGKIIWEKSFGGKYYDIAHQVLVNDKGEIYVIGNSNSESITKENPIGNKSATLFGEQDVWILKLSKDGNVIWEKSYGGTANDLPNAATLTKDGKIYLAGTTESENNGNKTSEKIKDTDIWLLKLDENGEILLDKTYAYQNYNRAVSIEQSENGELLLGISSQEDTKSSDYQIVKITSTGEPLWNTSIGGNGNDVLTHAFETKEGYFLAGTSDSSASKNKRSKQKGQQDAWLISVKKEEKLKDVNSEIKVFPNPTERFLTIEIPEKVYIKQKISTAKLYDLSGALVKEVTLKTNTNTLDVNSLPKGIYVLNFGENSYKIVKK